MGDHTESIEIDFDPSVISYDGILDIFWSQHDPTRNSSSRQYMHAVFYSSAEQQAAALASAARIEKKRGKIATHILPRTEFTLAEDYHQKYHLRQQRELMAAISRKFSLSPSAFTDSTAIMLLNSAAGGDIPASALNASALGLDAGDLENVKQGSTCCVM